MGHERLRRSPDVIAALRRGRRAARPAVVVHVLHRGDGQAARVAVVASRRVGGAVRRNRAKRVLRAAAEQVQLPIGVDVALVARPSTPDCSSRAVMSQLRSGVEHLFDAISSPGSSS